MTNGEKEWFAFVSDVGKDVVDQTDRRCEIAWNYDDPFRKARSENHMRSGRS